MSKIKIEIAREPYNVRFGSRAWAASLPAHKWQWKLRTDGDGDVFLDILNAGQAIVSLFVCNEGNAVWTGPRATRATVEYGGKNIGVALYGDLCAWAKSLDLDADDSGELAIASKRD